MSIHARKAETESKLVHLKRVNFISSLIISLLTVVLLMLVLSFFFLRPMLREAPVIVTYESGSSEPKDLEEKKVETRVDPKPAAPSASMARVIAANTRTEMAVPQPEVEVTTPSLDFGDGDEFGNGWGNGDGFGKGGGATFFNQKVKARRVAYVIDYSLSMRGKREKLMRNELRKSVSGLSSDMDYQLLFFAGPTWVAGDQVQMPKGRKSATVNADGESFAWISDGKAHGWEPKGNRQKPSWVKSGNDTRKQSLQHVSGSPLVWGTDWQPALEMAIRMDPPPEVIFFMTDGVTGGDAVSIAKSIATRAKAKHITINTVAMMEPRAELAMKQLAKLSGGQFSIIDKDGQVHTKPLE